MVLAARPKGAPDQIGRALASGPAAQPDRWTAPIKLSTGRVCVLNTPRDMSERELADLAQTILQLRPQFAQQNGTAATPPENAASKIWRPR